MGYWTAAAATGRLRLSPSLLPIKPDEILPELLTKRDRETKKLTRRLKFASDSVSYVGNRCWAGRYDDDEIDDRPNNCNNHILVSTTIDAVPHTVGINCLRAVHYVIDSRRWRPKHEPFFKARPSNEL